MGDTKSSLVEFRRRSRTMRPLQHLLPLDAVLLFLPLAQTGWEKAGRWADLISLVGFPLGLLGLYLTFQEARRSAKRSQEAKTASQSAQEAVRNFRRDLTRLTTISDLSKALSLVSEIKRLLMQQSLEHLTERLSEMRGLLIAIRGASAEMTEEQKSSFQSCIVNNREIENSLIQSQAGGPPVDIPGVAQVISADADSLHEILTQMKVQIGE